MQLVVVSATAGTTECLLALIDESFAENKSKTTAIIQALRMRHTSIVSALGLGRTCIEAVNALLLEAETLSEGERLLHDHSAALADRILSIGERMSALFFTAYLRTLGINASEFDVRDVLRTDSSFSQANVHTDHVQKLTRRRLIPCLAVGKVLVTQGFIGCNARGQTTTLGRGGSDYTATLLAEALGANCVHIWTDVSGIKTSDPHMVPNAKHIHEISFNEAAALTTFGAHILHPATLKPAIRKNIPIFIGSSFEPKQTGTWIKKQVAFKPTVRAISVRRKQRLFTFTSRDIYHTHSFFSRVFKVLAQYKVATDLMASSECSLSLILDSSQRMHNEALLAMRQISEVVIEHNLALIALIGNHIHRATGIFLKAIQHINPISLRLIVHGVSEHNLCLLIADHHAEAVVQRMHDQFIIGKNVHELHSNGQEKPSTQMANIGDRLVDM